MWAMAVAAVTSRRLAISQPFDFGFFALGFMGLSWFNRILGLTMVFFLGERGFSNSAGVASVRGNTSWRARTTRIRKGTSG